MWFMPFGDRCLSGRQSGETASAQAHIASQCEGPKARAADKKKARQIEDAPSNKTFGNCMLGLHCSQKPPAASRIFTGFGVVARCQQRKLSTTYQQVAVDILGMTGDGAKRCQDRAKSAYFGFDCSGSTLHFP
jgi:hypothetical protein